jgi:hypothetical protein
MVVALGHRHRFVTSKVIDPLDGDAKVEHSCDKRLAEVMGPDVAEAGSLAR